VKEYGIVEAEGTPGYHSAHINMRAPRVAVRVESAQHWQSMFALAMWMAAGWWGGYGFIYLPRGTGTLHPALARILDAYDPDYLVDALWTHGDIEALEPGWHARHYKGWPADPGESVALLAQQALAEQVAREDLGEDIGANLCSPHYDAMGYSLNRSCPAQRVAPGRCDLAELNQRPGLMTFSYRSCSTYVNSPDDAYDEQGRFRRMRVLSPRAEGDERNLATVLGGNPRPDFEIPEGLDPLLTLALGLRAGYPLSRRCLSAVRFRA
jgi:hypothetical protein